MDGRGYGSGFSSWGGGGGGSSRGSGNFDFGDYGRPMKRGMSGGSFLSSGADAVIAKINQRLDMLSHLEGGRTGGGRGDRFDQFESYDSRSSALGPRDLYRSGNFYGDSRGDMMAQRGGMGFGAMGGGGGGGGAGGFDGSPKMRRDVFSDSGWGAGQMSQQRGGRQGGPGFGRRQDPSMLGGGGGQGLSPSGLGKLPSLLSPRLYPDRRGFQPQQRSQFGNQRDNRQQRNRKKGLNRPQQVKPQREGQKKRKQAFTPTQEPESKVGKKETPGNNDKESEEKSDAAAAATPDTESKPEAEAQPADSASKEAGAQPKTKGVPSNKNKKRRGVYESRSTYRVVFACSICKYRSFYGEDMQTHLESKFHKDHIKFLTNQLTKPTTDFLQAYLNDKFKKTELRVKKLENPTAAICQVMKEQDLTRDLTLDHFMKKVEAAYCAACDMYIPMQPALVQKHVKSPDHNYNRRGMLEQSKRSSLSVARSILNHKVIGKKMETFLKGENPFLDDPEDSIMSEVTELEPKPEGEEPAADQPPAAVDNGEEEEQQQQQEEEEEAAEPEDMELGFEFAPEEEEEEEGAPVRQGEGEEEEEEEEGEQVYEEEEEGEELREDEGVEVGEEELAKLSELI